MPELRRILLGLIGAAAMVAVGPVAAAPGDGDIAKARSYLRKGDGIAAEVELRRAMAAGAPKPVVAAAMGEAWLDQGDRQKAREWLGKAEFAPGTEVYGLRMLARLERFEGKWQAASEALERAHKLAPGDAPLWVDIAYLNYITGGHLQAIKAVDTALARDPQLLEALLLRGQLARDAFGPALALPWFEAALARAPEDVGVMGEYAATLGEAGQHAAMLVVVRKIHSIDGDNPRAYYLQAVLAARAGQYELARGIANRIKGPLRNLPAVQLLQGALELEAGNTALAIELLDGLAHRQPANLKVRHLLARALLEADENALVVKRYGPHAARRDASPYLLTVVARAYENLGQRDLAAPLLDRAAAEPLGQLAFLDENFSGLARIGPQPAAHMRELLGTGQSGAAVGLAERERKEVPGSGDILGLTGDALVAAGRPNEALQNYYAAAQVRLGEDLLLRMLVAQGRAGKVADQGPLIARFHAGNPVSRLSIRLLASDAAQRGDFAAARPLLQYLVDRGGSGDARLLCDLAFVQLQTGDKAVALQTAELAYHQQPASLAATQILGMALAATGERPRAARSLLDKAKRLGGNNPQLAAARKQVGLP